MRVGFVGPFSSMANSDYGSERQIGAIERQILGLGTELASLGHEIFVTRNWTEGPSETMIDKIHLENISVFGAPQRGFYDSGFPFGHLSRVYYLMASPVRLRELGLDVMSVSGVLAAFLSSMLVGNEVRKVFLANNNDVFVDRGSGHSRIPPLTIGMLRTIDRRFDATVAVTRGVQDYLQKRGVRCSEVIPNALDPEKYLSKADEGFILTAGRLVAHKKVEDLVHAFSMVSKTVDEDLVIVGSGPQERAIRNQINRMGLDGRVKVLPFMPHSSYRDLLSRCSFFVLPSVAETFGVALIEAMASTKPVIARDTVGPRDIVGHGRDGYLFRTQSDLARCISLLSSDRGLRVLMGKTARRTVEQRFSLKNTARQFELLLNSLSH